MGIRGAHGETVINGRSRPMRLGPDAFKNEEQLASHPLNPSNR
jgi:hypothetical protein